VSCFFLLNGHHSTASINWRNPGRQVLLTTRIHLLWQVIEWFADYAQVRLSGDLSISVRRFSSPAGAMHPALSGVVLCFSRETDDLHERKRITLFRTSQIRSIACCSHAFGNAGSWSKRRRGERETANAIGYRNSVSVASRAIATVARLLSIIQYCIYLFCTVYCLYFFWMMESKYMISTSVCQSSHTGLITTEGKKTPNKVRAELLNSNNSIVEPPIMRGKKKTQIFVLSSLPVYIT
jgi:hypothetical protein